MRQVNELRPREWSEKFRDYTSTFEPELQRRQRAFPPLTSQSFGQAIYQIGQAITAANEYVLDETTSKLVDLVIADMSLGRQQILTNPDNAVSTAFDGVQLLCAQYQALRRIFTFWEESAARGDPGATILTAIADLQLQEAHLERSFTHLPPPPAYLDEICTIAESIRHTQSRLETTYRSQTPMNLNGHSAGQSRAQSLSRSATPRPPTAAGASSGSKRPASVGAPTRRP